MTTDNSNHKSSYQHPLFRSDAKYLPSPSQQPRAALRPLYRPPTTFDEILPTQPQRVDVERPSSSSNAPPPSSTREPEPSPPSSATPSRASRFFAHFHIRSQNSTATSQAKGAQLHKPSKQERRQRRQQFRELVKQQKAERKEAQRLERARTQWLGGMAWGFDPNAGQRLGTSSSDYMRTSCATQDGSEVSAGGPSSESRFSNGRTGKENGSHMGVETGGPGREGRFDYGLLKSRQVGSPGDPKFANDSPNAAD